jgi:putative thioredoxin
MAPKQHVSDVTEKDFQKQVVDASRKVPVLVDFWADWCGPCRVLGPVLERLADEMNGGFELAKVNADANPTLASRFGVRSLPSVLLFKDGNPIDGFIGAQPEGAVREFLRSHVKAPAPSALDEAARHLANGNAKGAKRAFEEALRVDAEKDEAHLGLARLALVAGDLADAEHEARAVDAGSRAASGAQSILDAIALIREAQALGERKALAQRLAANAGDLEARFGLAGHELMAGRHRDALEQYLAVARADKKWRDEAGRKAMVTTFNVIGPRAPLSEEFRDRLRSIYY